MSIDAGAGGGTKKVTTPNDVLLGLFDKRDPLTYFVALGIFTVILLLIAQKSAAIALGLAVTVLLAVAFAFEKSYTGGN